MAMVLQLAASLIDAHRSKNDPQEGVVWNVVREASNK